MSNFNFKKMNEHKIDTLFCANTLIYNFLGHVDDSINNRTAVDVNHFFSFISIRVFKKGNIRN